MCGFLKCVVSQHFTTTVFLEGMKLGKVVLPKLTLASPSLYLGRSHCIVSGTEMREAAFSPLPSITHPRHTFTQNTSDVLKMGDRQVMARVSVANCEKYRKARVDRCWEEG